MKRVITLGIVLAVGAFAGCSKSPTEPGEGGGGGGTTPTVGYSLFAMVFKVNGASATIAQVFDSTGSFVSDAIIKINDKQLIYFNGAYYSDSVTYESGQTYNLVAIIGGDTFTTSATAPTIDDVIITSPDSGATFPAGSAIPVSWQYVGGTNDKYVMVTASNGSMETVYISDFMDGSTTSHTIPGSATDSVGVYYIQVLAGDYNTIDGLMDPDPLDKINGSFLAVVVWDEVEINIGD